MEIRFSVDEEFIKNLQNQMKEPKATEVVRSALTLLNWVVDEAKRGHLILSANRDGTTNYRLALPVLDRVSPRQTDSTSAEKQPIIEQKTGT